EARGGDVDRRAQDRERQREDDLVGRDGDAVGEAQRVRAGRRLADRGEHVAALDRRLADRPREAVDDLVVAAAHVVLLVRRAEDPQLAL
ncbi:MAG: hypothetical protein AVDCRST_MAG85-212, partial [uncultured Solirubrobacteraceae bacterium]